MGSLIEVIKDEQKRKAVIDDCVALIEAEVAEKKGLSGMAIKAGYKTVKSIRPGTIPMALHHMLDDFAAKVDPYWQQCLSEGKDPRSFFTDKSIEIANALLSITDARAQRARNKVIAKTYHKLRPTAVDHVAAAMPRLADLLQKYAS